MKYLIILLLFLSGCASMSDYERGCNDGIRLFAEPQPNDQKGWNKLNADAKEMCRFLDRLDRENKKVAFPPSK